MRFWERPDSILARQNSVWELANSVRERPNPVQEHEKKILEIPFLSRDYLDLERYKTNATVPSSARADGGIRFLASRFGKKEARPRRVAGAGGPFSRCLLLQESDGVNERHLLFSR